MYKNFKICYNTLHETRINYKKYMNYKKAILSLFLTLTCSSAYAGTVTGRAFIDFNQNGIFDDNFTTASSGGTGSVTLAVDYGVGGVNVELYDQTGALVGSAVTSSDPLTLGEYSITTPVNGPYRVQFKSSLSEYGFGPKGINNETSVRFISDNDALGVDIGLSSKELYCNNDPLFAVNYYSNGDQSAAYNVDKYTLIGAPYTAGDHGSLNPADFEKPEVPEFKTPAKDIGTTWGLAYSKKRKIVYAASFYKINASFGPGKDKTYGTSDDAGAIYAIDKETGAVVDTFTVPNATLNAHTPLFAHYNYANFIVWEQPAASFGTYDAVGKTSLGGVALSEDETKLYVINLEDRKLYMLDAVTGAFIASQPIPLAPDFVDGGTTVATNPDDLRPFAVEVHKGKVYVGVLDSAQSTTAVDTFDDGSRGCPVDGRFSKYNIGDPCLQGTFPAVADFRDPSYGETFVDNDGNEMYNLGDARMLRAFVFTADPNTLVFDTAPTLTVPLNYPRGAHFTYWYPAVWKVWFKESDLPNLPQPHWVYSMPMFTGISFDERGDMYLGLRDRGGDILSLPGGGTAGDTLKACKNGSTWELESNGRCGGRGTAPQNTDEGPGRGEFFFEDYYVKRNHEEVPLGGVAHIPGFPDIMVTAFDPLFNMGTDDGGVRWFSRDNGTTSREYRIYDNLITIQTFGKANGIGDIVALCDEAGVEIGNYVWEDTNKNGAQDANEGAISGVELKLVRVDNQATIATATTDKVGNYIFSSRSGVDTTSHKYNLILEPNVQYKVVIERVSGPSIQEPLALNSYEPCQKKSGIDPLIDSNGEVNGSNFESIFTIADIGRDDHSIDFCFTANPPVCSRGDLTSTLISLDHFLNSMNASIKSSVSSSSSKVKKKNKNSIKNVQSTYVAGWTFVWVGLIQVSDTCENVGNLCVTVANTDLTSSYISYVNSIYNQGISISKTLSKSARSKLQKKLKSNRDKALALASTLPSTRTSCPK